MHVHAWLLPLLKILPLLAAPHFLVCAAMVTVGTPYLLPFHERNKPPRTIQLDLFDAVMLEDKNDAMATGMVGGIGKEYGDENIGGAEIGKGGGEPMEFLPDPLAVASMRSVIEKLENKNTEEALAIADVVKTIAENMDKMVNVCTKEQWENVRSGSPFVLGGGRGEKNGGVDVFSGEGGRHDE